MDVFNEDFISFWSSLNTHSVKFIMVGGVATNLHGYQRTTDDIDVWIEDTLENRRRLRAALKEYSRIDYFMLERLQIIPGWTNFALNNGVRLDLMVSIKGLEGYSFDECLVNASIADIDGVRVPFLHINQLIEAKKAANRPKDQVDIIYLEKIKKLQKGGTL
jgi:predicted nucleotidyltransferase